MLIGAGIYTTYRYFTTDQLEEQLDIKDATQDVIINFKTRDVISVYGFEYDDVTYYELQQMR